MHNNQLPNLHQQHLPPIRSMSSSRLSNCLLPHLRFIDNLLSLLIRVLPQWKCLLSLQLDLHQLLWRSFWNMYGCSSDANLFNQMCLLDTFVSSTVYGMFVGFPASSGLVVGGSVDCNDMFYSGTTVSLNLDNLASYQIAITWKVFSTDPSASYTITLTNSQSSQSTTQSTTSQSYSFCTSNTSRQYNYATSSHSFTSLKIQNNLTFSSSSELAVQQIVIKMSKCNSLCIECSQSQCTKCQLDNLYTQDANCVYSCKSGYYIYENATSGVKMCLQSCPVGTYGLSSNLSCVTCQSPCENCLDSTACLSCLTGFYLEGTACVTNCSYQYFGSDLTRTCQNCVGRCNQCQSEVICLSCKVGFYYSTNNSCLDSCSPSVGLTGQYADLSTLSCQTCNSSCQNCQKSSTLCTSCIAGKYFYDSSCVDACPSAYYSDNSSICQQCQYPCSQCSLEASNCSACVDRYLLNSSCIVDCPVGYYEDNSLLSCTVCGTGCEECVGSDSYCTSCLTSYFYFNHSCYSTCPDQYYGNQTSKACTVCQNQCLTCTNATFCLSCKLNFLLDGSCVSDSSCPDGFFGDISTLTCMACDSVCLLCQYSSTRCTACHTTNTTLIYLQNNGCTASCSSSYYYPTTLNNISQCTLCQQPCQTCTNESYCLTCISGYHYANGICSTSCPYGSFFNTTNSQCTLCSSNCLVCTSSTFCQTCANDYYIYSSGTNVNDCRNSCPDQYYVNTISKSCVGCLYPCGNCSSAIDCSTCVSGVLYSSRCISSCPDTTYFDNATNSCINCTANCLTCLQSSTHCLTCQTSYFLYKTNSSCLSTCPDSTYAESITQTCLSCPSSCATCSNNTFCLSCNANQTYLTSSNACVQLCPVGFYGYSGSGVCESCSGQCLTCSVTSTNCLSCATDYKIMRVSVSELTCVTNCSSGYYDENSNCYQCIFPCETCTSASQCITCVTGTYFYSTTSTCLLTCPSLTYTNYADQTCQLCTSPCSSCKTTATTCLSCSNDLFLYSNTCVASCPDGYYGDSTKICQKCSGLCNTCSSKFYCQSCLTGYLSQGYCYSSCPAGTYANTNTTSCIACTSPCLECSFSDTYCTRCVSGKVVYLGSCSQTCPFSTFQENSQCQLCTFPCVNCTSSVTCTQCLGGYLLYNDLACINDTTYCPNDFYKKDGKYCIPLAQCPSGYYTDDSLRTCSSSCSQQKYTNTDSRTCGTSCQSFQYVGANMICINYTTTPPTSLMHMQAISYIRSSIMIISITFNESSTWQIINQNLYTITSVVTTSRLLQSTNLTYILDIKAPQQIIMKVAELPLQVNVQLPSHNVISGNSGYNLQNANLTVKLDSYVAYDYQHIYQGDIASQYGTGLSWFIILLSIFFLVSNRLSDLYILWDTSQLLYVILFLQIQYPPTLNQFLKGLSVTMFVGFPNMFPAPDTRNVSAPSFYAYSFDNNFLRNAGPSLTLLIIAIIVYAVFKILELLIKNTEKLKKCASDYPKFKNLVYSMMLRYRWHHASDIIFLTYLSVFMFAAAEISYMDKNTDNLTSNVLCIMSLIGYIIFPCFVSYKLYKHFPNISKGKMVQNLRCFYRGIEKTNKFGVFLIIIRYFRKLIYALVIAVFSDRPMYALPILMFTSMLMGLFIFINVPFQKKLSNIVETLTQICLALLYLLIALVNFNNEEGNKDFNIILGYIGCFLLSFILLMLVFEIFVKTLFQLEEQTPKRSTLKLQKMEEDQLRKKAGQFFDFIFPKIKKEFKFSDDSEDAIFDYEQGDSQNSENNNERKKDFDESSQNHQQEFKHYENNSQSEEPATELKIKEKQPPVYLIRCQKQLR